ncbi:MAG: hypothetical protein M1830_007859 [Pleopsidium flavum]|nr:MAG: hypothetical protein M1830_007859 [Pleopsidium flavum]
MTATFFFKSAMSKSKIVEGVFAINKPPGISSAQVVRDLQKAFNPSKLFAPWLEAEKANRSRESHNQRFRRRDKRQQVKIGHGGTLDPLATGVLIAGVGKGTKQLQGFLECTKAYEAVVLFGVATDTYDREGKVVGRAPYAHVTRESVEKALAGFRGKIMQKPPLFSALRIQGKRLYDYARGGEDLPVEIQERPVEVKQLDIVEWLDGGRHQYEWPTEEMRLESEKTAAAKVLQIDAVKEEDDEQANEKRLDVEKVLLKSGTKRKRSMDNEDDLVYDKKLRKDDPELVMSGGLQSLGEERELGPPGRSSPVVPSARVQSPTGSEAAPGPPAIKLRMTVTSGFYVRSLCHDLGKAVQSLAIMSELIRTRQGDFEIGKNVLDYDDLAKDEDLWGPRVEKMLHDWNELSVAEGDRTKCVTEDEHEVTKLRPEECL